MNNSAEANEGIEITKSPFRHALQKDRLGTGHTSLDSYFEAVKQTGKRDDTAPIEFSLVALLSPNADPKRRPDSGSGIRILLGKKLRGFGRGFYNCFGGKLERSLDERAHPARGAVRELREEAGIRVPLSAMEDGYVGTLNFTFDDWEVNEAMKVYLHCVVVSLSSEEDGANATARKRDEAADLAIDPKQIRGCEEIEPRWFNDVYDIPLNQMFADDSLWLTILLKHYDDMHNSLNENTLPSSTFNNQHPNQSKFMFDGWFHFASGGADTNQILHHYLKTNQHDITLCSSHAPPPAVKYTLEKQLFHALHLNRIHSPSIKEFKENWAMANTIRKYLGDQDRMEYVIDVAGGHGALAALFLVLAKKCHTAIVIDPAVVNGKEGILQAWSSFWNRESNGAASVKNLRYRHECLRTGLRDELEAILNKNTGSVGPANVLVVACHACQHLTDETMQIASEYGVNIACMPCCQKDHDGWWKRSAKQIGLSIGSTMDLLSAGKMMAWETGSKAGVKYQVKMKLIDEKISPLQNRIILCKAIERDGYEDAKTQLAHEKLAKAYRRAHRSTDFDNITQSRQSGKAEILTDDNGESQDYSSFDHGERSNYYKNVIGNHFASLLTGFCIGTAFTFILTSKIRR